MNKKWALLLVLLAACLGYSLAFLSAGRLADIKRFDSILAMDTAQIARNTLRGNILETRYILPVSYALFHTLDHMPDYIRYPLPIMKDVILFAFAPASPVSVKILNAILFVVNAALMYYIALSLIKRREDWAFPPEWARGLSVIGALGASFLVLPYLRLSLTDAYEIVTATVVLVAFIVTFVHKKPLLAGILASMVYLSRYNMGVFVPVMLGFLVYQAEGRKAKVRAAVVFLAASFVVMLPFICRNMLLTHKPMFSLQQSIEFLKGVKGTHEDFYYSFAVPPKMWPMSMEQFHGMVGKVAGNLYAPIYIATRVTFLPAWAGLLMFVYFFKKERLVLLSTLAFVALHAVFCAFLLQLPRVYVPVLILPVVLGWTGLAAAAGTMLRSARGWKVAAAFAAAVLLMTVAPAALGGNLKMIPIGFPHPPSDAAIAKFDSQNIRYVYANDPFWVTWYTDKYAIYAPQDPKEMLEKGPAECTHFFADKRYPYPADYLRQNARVVYEDGECAFFAFNAAPKGTPAPK